MSDANTLSRDEARQLVLDMMEMLVDPEKSDQARRYLTDSYIQHNPNIPSGIDAIIDFTRSELAEKARNEMRPATDTPPKFVVEGNMIVMALPRDLPDPHHPGETYRTWWFDMWRIENGKLAEHWDGAVKE